MTIWRGYRTLVAALALAGGVLLATASVKSAAGRPSMDIKVTLHLDRDTLIAGERISLTIKVRNISKHPISIPDPALHPQWPKLLFRDMQTGKESLIGPSELEIKQRHDPVFLPKMPQPMITLPPGGEASRTADLAGWVGDLRPGRYELAAVFTWADAHDQSPVAVLRVEPADIVSADMVGSDSGYGQLRYVLWAAKTSRGAILLRTSFSFDNHGHPFVVESFRVAEVPGTGTAAISVTPNRSPWPDQWIVWFDGQTLSRLYLMQGRVAVALRSDRMALSGPAELVGPVVLEKNSDINKPGAGWAALWQDGNLTMERLDANGDLTAGPRFPLEPGKLLWGRIAWLSTGVRRIVLALDHGDKTALELIEWSGGAAATARKVAEWAGSAIGGGMTLDAADGLSGALVLETHSGYSIQPWQVDTGGAFTARPARSLATALAFHRAQTAVSPRGQTIAILEPPKGQRFLVSESGIVVPVSGSLSNYGVPIDGYWLTENAPYLAMAGRDTGITLQAAR